MSPDRRLQLRRCAFPILAAAWIAGLTSCATPAPRRAEAGADRAAREALARRVVIHRDAFGVPHIHGETDAAAVFGYLYAQAEDNFWQLEENTILALGRAAEAYGERALAGDLLVRALEIPRLAREEYEHAPPEIRRLCDAGAMGVRHFLAEHPEVRPRVLETFEPWYFFALTRYGIYVLFVTGRTGLRLAELQDAVREVRGPQEGSNMWAAGPGKCDGARALLFINPHQPFFGPGQFYEGHLLSDEGWNISGASFFGSPFPALGTSEVHGWSHTVNHPDIADVYIESFDDPSEPLAYRWGSQTLRAVEWEDTVRVRASQGLETRTFRFLKTHHGPIVALRDGKPLALRLARFEEGGQLGQWYAMSKARNLTEFRAALSRLAVPMFNTLYADAEGNIYYVYNGAIPRRDPGFDWNRPVDGSDPRTEWRGYHTLEELPQILNPPGGWLQNCNQSPFHTTGDADPRAADFPPYMTSEDDNLRAAVSREILSSRPRFDFERWSAAAFDTRVLAADRFLAALVEKAARAAATAGGRTARLLQALELLRSWDRVGRTDSAAMTLFALWLERLGPRADWAAVPEERAARSLSEVLDALEKAFGDWRVPWGEINRLQRIHTSGRGRFRDDQPSLPVAGGPGWLGMVFNFYARPVEGARRRYGVAGHSFVKVAAFGPKTKARSVLVFGESADPESPHYFDQARLYARGTFKPSPVTLEEVLESAVRSYRPGEEAEAAAAESALPGGEAPQEP